MRRHRRYGDTSDNEHMMLDTVCNVFGAIVLMGVLVVVSTHAGAARVQEHEEEAALSRLDARSLRLEINGIQATIDELQNQLDEYTRLYEETVPSDVATLSNVREDLNKRLREAQRKLNDLEKRGRSLQEELDVATDLTATVEDDIADTERLITELEQGRSDAPSHKPRNVRLPWGHRSTAGSQQHFVVIERRVYPVDGVNCRNVRSTALTGTFVPVNGRGFPVTRGGANIAFARSLKGSGRTSYIVFWFHATNAAFESVQTLRKIVAEKGYEFAYVVYSPGQAIRWSTGGGPDAQ